MGTSINPAMDAFLASFGDEREWAQAVVRRTPAGFELRHAADRAAESAALRELRVEDLRKFSATNAAGQFRPIKAAPDLPAGWRATATDDHELWRALMDLYPGSVPDWHAVQTGAAAPTHYREFTNRQSGMYRIAQLLNDEQASHTAAACCHPRHCLKRRLWTVAECPPDPESAKSAIPCLEPCAVLLELARKAARIEQEEKIAMEVTPSDLESLLAAAEWLAANPPPALRTGDVSSGSNPRRLQLLLEKYRSKVDRSAKSKEST
jgi:hypothetical protein